MEKPNLREIQIGGATITLLGTAHVSKTSVEEVKRELASKRYDAIALELCRGRYQSLSNPNSVAQMDLHRILKEKRVLMVIANLALAAYQQHIADEIGIEPGAEMKAAIEIARQMNIPLWLIDREIAVTLKRVAGNLSSSQRTGLIMGLLSAISTPEKVTEAEIEKLKEGDILESTLYQIAAQNEYLFKPLIKERDEYMALKLQSQLNDESQNVLAIVGAAHLPGISKALANPIPDREKIKARLTELEQVKMRGKWLKILHWLMIMLIVSGFALGFSRSPELGQDLVIEWIVINASLSALATALAAAHPVTVIVAFLTAPLMSLTPVTGAGFLIAATELVLRKPRADDFKSLRRETVRLKGWWKNRVARTLLIFLFSTLGSALGMYIAGFRILEKLLAG
ncbi:MAG: TraB/GumN family protein [Methylococcales bacterium]